MLNIKAEVVCEAEAPTILAAAASADSEGAPVVAISVHDDDSNDRVVVKLVTGIDQEDLPLLGQVLATLAHGLTSQDTEVAE